MQAPVPRRFDLPEGFANNRAIEFQLSGFADEFLANRDAR
jgi:hypothetical protein